MNVSHSLRPVEFFSENAGDCNCYNLNVTDLFFSCWIIEPSSFFECCTTITNPEEILKVLIVQVNYWLVWHNAMKKVKHFWLLPWKGKTFLLLKKWLPGCWIIKIIYPIKKSASQCPSSSLINSLITFQFFNRKSGMTNMTIIPTVEAIERVGWNWLTKFSYSPPHSTDRTR